ncbi:ROK family protein [Falsihalocynthiibacter sp. S25ZX9]|uniref:ROK family protein n=1 Tax=Falsihalocynthiibacter sp. S25ZX9 TaxID=3240870 RepID=UPI00350EE29A
MGPKSSLLAAGIDIGGGSAKIGLVSPDGKILDFSAVPTPMSNNPADVLDAYLDHLIERISKIGIKQLDGIGVGVPGHVDSAKSTTHLSNVPALNGYPIKDHVQEKFRTTVLIENDATFAALGEHHFGSGRSSRRFLMVTLGTGIGAAFIENGLPFLTGNGALGDASHLIVDPSLKHGCRQGCRGCIESVASGEALGREINKIAARDPASFLGKITQEGFRRPNIEDLIDGAKLEDSDCKELLDKTAHWLSLWLTGLIHIFAPDRIAFGGGWSAAGQGFIDKIANHSAKVGMSEYFTDLEFIQTSLGNRAGVVGAATSVLQKKLEG